MSRVDWQVCFSAEILKALEIAIDKCFQRSDVNESNPPSPGFSKTEETKGRKATSVLPTAVVVAIIESFCSF